MYIKFVFGNSSLKLASIDMYLQSPSPPLYCLFMLQYLKILTMYNIILPQLSKNFSYNISM